MQLAKKIKSLLRENTILLVVSFFIFNSDPAILQAQDVNPYSFTEPLSVSRGRLMPSSQDAMKIPRDEMCDLVKSEWGWESCDSVDAMVISFTPAIDSLLINKPNTSGYVKLQDWETDEREEVIAAIESDLRKSMKSQGARTGQKITFDGWRVYPTLNSNKKYMYYATNVSWDGELYVNVKAVVFDRRGYVDFSIVPTNSNISQSMMVSTINTVLDKYQPKPQEDYSSFVSGDKIAAVGAVGVLATLAGVKYGKAATGLLVGLLLVLKKGAFLLLLPLFWILGWLKRLFSKPK